MFLGLQPMLKVFGKYMHVFDKAVRVDEAKVATHFIYFIRMRAISYEVRNFRASELLLNIHLQ